MYKELYNTVICIAIKSAATSIDVLRDIEVRHLKMERYKQDVKLITTSRFFVNERSEKNVAIT